MTTATLSPIERSVLGSLADGRDDIQTAAQLRVPVATVSAIQHRFGPGRDRIRQVLDAATMPAPPRPITPRPIAPKVSPGRIELVGIEALLDEAIRHSQQRIVKKGARIRELLDELAKSIDEEREAEKRRRREQMERAAALAEVAALEEQLAAARAKIKRGRGRPAGTINGHDSGNPGAVRANQDAWLKERGVNFSDVLAWAKRHDIQRAGSLLSNATKKAWDEAHKAS